MTIFRIDDRTADILGIPREMLPPPVTPIDPTQPHPLLDALKSFDPNKPFDPVEAREGIEEEVFEEITVRHLRPGPGSLDWLNDLTLQPSPASMLAPEEPPSSFGS